MIKTYATRPRIRKLADGKIRVATIQILSETISEYSRHCKVMHYNLDTTSKNRWKMITLILIQSALSAKEEMSSEVLNVKFKFRILGVIQKEG